jgi:hypothetical protein
MAMVVGKEISWQDMPLFRLQHYKEPDTSSAILVPGSNSTIFRGRLTASGNELGILYPGISITMEVFDNIVILFLV